MDSRDMSLEISRRDTETQRAKRGRMFHAIASASLFADLILPNRSQFNRTKSADFLRASVSLRDVFIKVWRSRS